MKRKYAFTITWVPSSADFSDAGTWGRGHCWPPIFSRSVNLIPSKGWQILPTLLFYYRHPPNFSPSGFTGLNAKYKSFSRRGFKRCSSRLLSLSPLKVEISKHFLLYVSVQWEKWLLRLFPLMRITEEGQFYMTLGKLLLQQLTFT